MPLLILMVGGNKYQLMVKSHLWDRTEPVVFIRGVAKQHDVCLLRFAGAIGFRVLVSARASFWLDKKIQKLFECKNQHLFPQLLKWTLLLPLCTSSCLPNQIRVRVVWQFLFVYQMFYPGFYHRYQACLVIVFIYYGIPSFTTGGWSGQSQSAAKRQVPYNKTELRRDLT